jgi:DNA-binding transcriptional regulator YiaG
LGNPTLTEFYSTKFLDVNMNANSEQPPASGAARNPIDVHVGRRIRQLRLSRGIKQDSLALRIGATNSELEKYETGYSRIPADRLLRISRILNAPIFFFFESGDVATD